jgi:hypothetical protein
MTVTRSYTVWCEGTDYTYLGGNQCGEWLEEAHVSSVKEMREYVKGMWTHVGGKDYCPACSYALGYLKGPLTPDVAEFQVEARIPPSKASK